MRKWWLRNHKSRLQLEEYFESRFKDADNTENIPRIKLPIMLTNNTFETRLPNSKKGADVILYLRTAPKIAPTPRKRNSIPFIIYMLWRNKVSVKYLPNALCCIFRHVTKDIWIYRILLDCHIIIIIIIIIMNYIHYLQLTFKN